MKKTFILKKNKEQSLEPLNLDISRLPVTSLVTASPGRQASLPPGELAKFEVAAPAEVPAARTALRFAPWALDPVHLSAARMNEVRIEINRMINGD